MESGFFPRSRCGLAVGCGDQQRVGSTQVHLFASRLRNPARPSTGRPTSSPRARFRLFKSSLYLSLNQKPAADAIGFAWGFYAELFAWVLVRVFCCVGHDTMNC